MGDGIPSGLAASAAFPGAAGQIGQSFRAGSRPPTTSSILPAPRRFSGVPPSG
jgi:hypothetical protein